MPDLDDAYANGAHIDGADGFPPRWAQQAAAFRAALGARAVLDVPYGPSPRMAYDLFLPDGDPRGLMIFVHGGYWLRFDRKSWSHFAGGAVARGWTVAMPSYDLCPSVGIALITQQIAQAVRQLAARIDGPIALTGHSAGGHLVARMAAPGMLPTAVSGRVTHIAPISPVADLQPLLQTSMNASFDLDVETARAESPYLQPAPDCPVSIWVGADERPAFLDQAKLLADAWSAPCHVPQGRHHFDVIDALGDPQSALLNALLGTAQS